MTWMARTLWDLLLPSKWNGSAIVAIPTKRQRAKPQPTTAPPTKTVKVSMQEKYDAIVQEMRITHNIRVRKWRKSSSGVAWTIRYINSGKIVKLIEAPYPRGPMSCAIFLHEVGHHAIGLGIYKPRCLEEYKVWMWALELMREKGFNVTPAVEKRVERSMRYAVAKARRRGLKSLPTELQTYL